eukprot:6178353-Pyramimonas_sp.AAC.1
MGPHVAHELLERFPRGHQMHPEYVGSPMSAQHVQCEAQEEARLSSLEAHWTARVHRVLREGGA